MTMPAVRSISATTSELRALENESSLSPSFSNALPVPLLEVRNLCVEFAARTGMFGSPRGGTRAVDDVSLTIAPGETLGLVGESGCGKTTVGRAILRLIPVTSGSIFFQGESVLQMKHAALRTFRRAAQIVFQDPAGSLNPRMRIGEIIGEPLLVHRLAKGQELQQRVYELLERVGLPREAAQRYPHEFSGGQRQRIGIARALSLQPRLIICDEPTSALDVSIQSQILNLLKDLQDSFGLSYLFISHDMAVIHHMCDRIAVMWKGRIVEQGEGGAILSQPQHEYTRTLLNAVPVMDPRAARKSTVSDTIPA